MIRVFRTAGAFVAPVNQDRGVTLEDYNAFCRKLPHTSHVVQWGGAHVWKVDGKVFAIAWAGEDKDDLLVTFRCSQTSYELLQELPGLRPAPYLASRGMKWIQRTGNETMDDGALRDYLAESHRIIASGLAKRRQLELAIGLHAKPPATPKSTAVKSATRQPRTSRANGGKQP